MDHDELDQKMEQFSPISAIGIRSVRDLGGAKLHAMRSLNGQSSCGWEGCAFQINLLAISTFFTVVALQRQSPAFFIFLIWVSMCQVMSYIDVYSSFESSKFTS